MIPDKETRDIQAYLRGTLPKIRREKFEQRLLTDTVFAQKYNDLKPIFETLLDIQQEQGIKAILEESEETQFEEEPPVKEPISLFKRVTQYAIAASVLLLLGTVWYDSTYNSRLYDSFYESEKEGTRGVLSEECPDTITISLYYQKKYIEMLDVLNKQPASPCSAYYKGLCYLELEDGVKAISLFKQAQSSNNKFIKNSADWYMSLAYLKNDEEEKAKEVLEQILKTNEHQYELRAKDLKIKLEKEPFLFRIRF